MTDITEVNTSLSVSEQLHITTCSNIDQTYLVFLKQDPYVSMFYFIASLCCDVAHVWPGVWPCMLQCSRSKRKQGFFSASNPSIKLTQNQSLCLSLFQEQLHLSLCGSYMQLGTSSGGTGQFRFILKWIESVFMAVLQERYDPHRNFTSYLACVECLQGLSRSTCV